MAHEVFALMKGGHIFTLRPCRYMPGFRFMGFRDGQRCGFFKSKKAFVQFVDREPDGAPLGPHADVTFRAEAWSTFEGLQALQHLEEAQRRMRETAAPDSGATPQGLPGPDGPETGGRGSAKP